MKQLVVQKMRFIKLAWAVATIFTFGASAFGATFTVTKTADTNDGACNADCSLREAITAANVAASNDVIEFDQIVFGTQQSIVLSGTSLEIENNGSLTINGTGSSLLTVSGNNQSRVFVFQGVTATLSGIEVTNGKILQNGDGGGIFNNLGIVTINNSIIRNNSAASNGFSGGGGGVYNRGTMFINGTTINNNSAASQGGGISNDSGASGTTPTITISNSVITDNTTNGLGAGLYNYFDCTMNVTNSIVRNNSANNGGGIFNNGTVTITGGSIIDNTAPQSGGGIGNDGRAMLTMTNVTVSGNSAGAFGGGISSNCNFGGSVIIAGSLIINNTASTTGGGVFANRCLLTISLSSISSNTATNGGGIYNDGLSSPFTVNDSIISNNTASGNGGGINNTGGTLNIANSTINGNSAAAATGEGGGGIHNSVSIANLINSTVYGNTTVKQGGGLFNRGTINLNGSTVSNNQAGNGGGGVFNFDTRVVNARNTIVGDNSTSAGIAPDFRGTLASQGYNLIEDTQGTAITNTTTGNILGRDPQLAPLRNYGGLTQTVALLPTSPAIDAGDPTNFLPTDQRGIARPQDGDLNGSALSDIGAYERQVSAILTVTKTADTNDGFCDADCSLREAVAGLNSSTGLDKAIIFAPETFSTPQTILLTLGELELNNTNGTSLIKGTSPDLLTINANQQSRVFFINNQTTAAIENLTATGGYVENDLRGGGGVLNNGRAAIRNMVIRNNTVNTDGGGFYNNGTASATILNSIIRDNIATAQGGGIAIIGGNVTVNQSTITGNRATTNGGGIFTGGNLLLSNSTVSGNLSNRNGGGIYSVGLFSGSTLINCTVTRNSAQQNGGGVFQSSSVQAGNTIIAGNTSAAANSGPDFDGNLFSRGYNLIGNTARTTFNGDTTGNLLNTDPQLLPLGNYGGATPTHALRLNSPAIDKGNNFGVTNDQRGFSRPYDFPNISNASGGNGTDIGAFERQVNESNGSRFFDFDGDGKSDISVFRPENGTWYLQQSAAGFTGLQFGISTDKIVPADYDGDGKTDIAVYRGGTWYLQRSQLGFTGIQFGATDDIPVPADYDGDGRADLAVFRSSTGVWYLQQSTAGFVGIAFGQSGDKPVAADYDGDGKTDLAVNRSGTWYILRSQLGFVGIAFGDSNDKTVPADYDGDGKADVAVFRPSNGIWYLQQSTAGFAGIAFGLGTDMPTAADYDGDGKADVALFRNGTWYLNRSTSGFTGIAFGAATDKPIPNAFVR